MENVENATSSGRVLDARRRYINVGRAPRRCFAAAACKFSSAREGRVEGRAKTPMRSSKRRRRRITSWRPRRSPRDVVYSVRRRCGGFARSGQAYGGIFQNRSKMRRKRRNVEVVGSPSWYLRGILLTSCILPVVSVAIWGAFRARRCPESGIRRKCDEIDENATSSKHAPEASGTCFQCGSYSALCSQ